MKKILWIFNFVAITFNLLGFESNLRTRALKGDVEAQMRLAFKEINITHNWSKALIWLEMAALRNHSSACHYLGVAYEKGLGTTKSEKLTVYWWDKGASLGSSDCMKSLAIFYKNQLDHLRSMAWIILYQDFYNNAVIDEDLDKLIIFNDKQLQEAKLRSNEIKDLWGSRPSSAPVDPVAKSSGFMKITLKDGGNYQGYTLDKLPHGYGMKKSASGEIYYGYFEKGLEHGFGTAHKLDGTIIYRGHWKLGMPK